MKSSENIVVRLPHLSLVDDIEPPSSPARYEMRPENAIKHAAASEEPKENTAVLKKSISINKIDVHQRPKTVEELDNDEQRVLIYRLLDCKATIPTIIVKTKIAWMRCCVSTEMRNICHPTVIHQASKALRDNYLAALQASILTPHKQEFETLVESTEKSLETIQNILRACTYTKVPEKPPSPEPIVEETYRIPSYELPGMKLYAKKSCPAAAAYKYS